ncbi:MAG: HAD family hydrolase [bacterium]|nr:MAG: HAD family hydrolase [bacterium]
MSDRSDNDKELHPAVLLDRDGTIIDETGYLGDPEGIHFLPGAIEALRILQQAGYVLIVVTNQSGIGRGYFSDEDAIAVNLRLSALLDEKGIHIKGIYHCPHSPDDGCACRKPGIKMTQRAVADFSLDIQRSWVVGDAARDIIMAQRAGARSILVVTGREDKGTVPEGTARAKDLLEAARMIAGEGS